MTTHSSLACLSELDWSVYEKTLEFFPERTWKSFLDSFSNGEFQKNPNIERLVQEYLVSSVDEWLYLSYGEFWMSALVLEQLSPTMKLSQILDAQYESVLGFLIALICSAKLLTKHVWQICERNFFDLLHIVLRSKVIDDGLLCRQVLRRCLQHKNTIAIQMFLDTSRDVFLNEVRQSNQKRLTQEPQSEEVIRSFLETPGSVDHPSGNAMEGFYQHICDLYDLHSFQVLNTHPYYLTFLTHAKQQLASYACKVGSFGVYRELRLAHGCNLLFADLRTCYVACCTPTATKKKDALADKRNQKKGCREILLFLSKCAFFSFSSSSSSSSSSSFFLAQHQDKTKIPDTKVWQDFVRAEKMAFDDGTCGRCFKDHQKDPIQYLICANPKRFSTSRKEDEDEDSEEDEEGVGGGGGGEYEEEEIDEKEQLRPLGGGGGTSLSSSSSSSSSSNSIYPFLTAPPPTSSYFPPGRSFPQVLHPYPQSHPPPSLSNATATLASIAEDQDAIELARALELSLLQPPPLPSQDEIQLWYLQETERKRKKRKQEEEKEKAEEQAAEAKRRQPANWRVALENEYDGGGDEEEENNTSIKCDMCVGMCTCMGEEEEEGDGEKPALTWQEIRIMFLDMSYLTPKLFTTLETMHATVVGKEEEEEKKEDDIDWELIGQATHSQNNVKSIGELKDLFETAIRETCFESCSDVFDPAKEEIDSMWEQVKAELCIVFNVA